MGMEVVCSFKFFVFNVVIVFILFYYIFIDFDFKDGSFLCCVKWFMKMVVLEGIGL